LTKLRSLRLALLRRLASLAGVEGLANLEELDIHSCRAIRSIEEIGSLSRLKKLFLNNDGEIESLKPIDNLDGLETIGFYESTNILDGDLSPLLRQRKSGFLARILSESPALLSSVRRVLATRLDVTDGRGQSAANSRRGEAWLNVS